MMKIFLALEPIKKMKILFGKSVESFVSEETIDKASLVHITESIYISMVDKSEVRIDEKRKIVEFSNISEKILIQGNGVLDGWTINLVDPLIKKDINSRIDENLLTGCLTIYNIHLKKVKFNIQGSECEDALNLLNVTGTIEEIYITDSSFDGLDLDFSELVIENLNITNSENDCLDLSSGNYAIKNLYVNQCLDKGISVGEGFSIVIQELSVSNTNIGFAIKDSSFSEIFNVSGKNNNYCISSYRKNKNLVRVRS